MSSYYLEEFDILDQIDSWFLDEELENEVEESSLDEEFEKKVEESLLIDEAEFKTKMFSVVSKKGLISDKEEEEEVKSYYGLIMPEEISSPKDLLIYFIVLFIAISKIFFQIISRLIFVLCIINLWILISLLSLMKNSKNSSS